MLVDARIIPAYERTWFIWHCELVKVIPYVVWFNDESNEYGTYRYCEDFTDQIIVHKAKKILVIPKSKVVLVNPLDDSDNFYENRKEVKWQHGVPKTAMMNV